ncbi:hypothetical protein DL89DRAFT_266712 [Linderina pennispora]|uniref:Uncharacterized protein n=1 Tax=Linderina pennispora TaxID=61395 RepID=A0A1Y1WAD1_9FUNG|nr:uncharacterized protein DL89DRAFT_266712 [Linderina pennispora]ORX70499.1 hypothetical protein DL89DRAFT_266712 [Linderina pennispora]
MGPAELTFTKAQLEKARSKRITNITVTLVVLGLLIILSLAVFALGLTFVVVGVTWGLFDEGDDSSKTNVYESNMLKAGIPLLILGFLFAILFSVWTRRCVVFRRKLRALDTPPEFILSKEAKRILLTEGSTAENYTVVVIPDTAPADSTH